MCFVGYQYYLKERYFQFLLLCLKGQNLAVLYVKQLQCINIFSIPITEKMFSFNRKLSCKAIRSLILVIYLPNIRFLRLRDDRARIPSVQETNCIHHLRIYYDNEHTNNRSAHSWLDNSVGKALHRYSSDHSFESRWSLTFVSTFFFSGFILC